MTIYNRKTNTFETYSNQTDFLAIQIDQDRHDLKEVIHLFEKRTDSTICIALNNEDDADLEKSLELFSNEDKLFCTLVDFFRYDNKDSLKEIINSI